MIVAVLMEKAAARVPATAHPLFMVTLTKAAKHEPKGQSEVNPRTGKTIRGGEFAPASAASSVSGKGEESPSASKVDKTVRAPKGVYDLPVGVIKVDPARFQFKAGKSQVTGAGDELTDVEKWDPDLAGIVLVWRDPANGKTYCVNGHHRVDLAKRLHVRRITVRYVDVPTAEKARIKGAITNIAEGRGTPVDAAKLFREARITPAQMREAGLSIKGSIAATASSLARLAPELWKQVTTGAMSEGRGAAIGGAFKSEVEQRALADMLKRPKYRRMPDSAVSEMAKFVDTAGRRQKTIMTLFGEESLEESLAPEKAMLSAVLKRRLASDRKLFGFVSKENRAKELARAGNVLNVAENKKISSEAAELEYMYDRLAIYRGPVADALREGAEQIAANNGKGVQDVAETIWPKVRDAIRSSLSGGNQRDAAGPGGHDQAGGTSSRPEEQVPPDHAAGFGGDGPGLFGDFGKSFHAARVDHRFRVLMVTLSKAHDVSSEPRNPKGSAGGGQWTKLGAGDAHPKGYAPSTAEARAKANALPGLKKVPPASWGLEIHGADAPYVATWYDQRGRRQYSQNKSAAEGNAAAKFEHINELRKRLPAIRRQIDKDLRLDDATRQKVLAAVVKLIDDTAIRIGGENYVTENGSHGAATLLKSHVEVKGNQISLDFPGKEGVRQVHTTKDPKLAGVLDYLKSLPGDRLFQARLSNGGLGKVTDDDVREYMAQFGTTPHKFRYYQATKIAAQYLSQRPAPATPKQAQTEINAAAKIAAETLGNAFAQTRDTYINPAVFDAYRKGHLRSEDYA